MDITVRRPVEWENEVYLRDEPFGDNGVFLKPLQVRALVTHTFIDGESFSLPQPDASYSCVSVVRWPQSWHFLHPGGELIIPSEVWPQIRQQILAICPLDTMDS